MTVMMDLVGKRTLRVWYMPTGHLDTVISGLCNACHVPRDQSHVPRDQSHVPRDQSHVPCDQSHVPCDQSHVPCDQSHVPCDQSHTTGPSYDVVSDVVCWTP